MAATARRRAASAASDNKGVKKKSGVDGTSVKHMHKELEKVVRGLRGESEGAEYGAECAGDEV